MPLIPFGNLSEPNESEKRKINREWLLIASIALFLHLVFLILPWDWIFPKKEFISPAPVKLQEIDPNRLAEIRKQWKTRKLLLKKDSWKERDDEAPEDADYFSNQNRKFREQQRARDISPNENFSPPVPQDPLETSKDKPIISDLGVPLKLAQSPRERAKTRPKNTGDQFLDDAQIKKFGLENLVNTKKVAYYAYFERIAKEVGPVWRSKMRSAMAILPPKLGAGEYRTVLHVTLDEKGNIVSSRIVQSSGVPEIDQVIYDAFAEFKRFPNPPKILFDENQRIHIGYTTLLSLSSGPGLQLHYRRDLPNRRQRFR